MTCGTCDKPLAECKCTPNREKEKREQLVNHAMQKLVSGRHTPKPEDDLDQMLKQFFAGINAVRILVTPVAQAAIDNGSVHSEQGRKLLMTHIHRCFLDYFKQFNRDELLWLLCLVHARLMMEEFV